MGRCRHSVKLWVPSLGRGVVGTNKVSLGSVTGGIGTEFNVSLRTRQPLPHVPFGTGRTGEDTVDPGLREDALYPSSELYFTGLD